MKIASIATIAIFIMAVLFVATMNYFRGRPMPWDGLVDGCYRVVAIKEHKLKGKEQKRYLLILEDERGAVLLVESKTAPAKEGETIEIKWWVKNEIKQTTSLV